MRKKIIFAILVAVALIFISFSAGYAINGLYKQVTGLGNASYSDEVTVTNLQRLTPTKVRTVLTSTINTVADQIYTVTLFADGLSVGTPQTISWSAVQIPGVNQNVIFTGLSLGDVTDLNVEVTK